MTSTTHPHHPRRLQRTDPTGNLRYLAAMPARFGRWLRAGVATFRHTGQLGASTDKEIGRSTGGRI
jgi:hypothetical protein